MPGLSLTTQQDYELDLNSLSSHKPGLGRGRMTHQEGLVKRTPLISPHATPSNAKAPVTWEPKIRVGITPGGKVHPSAATAAYFNRPSRFESITDEHVTCYS
ncbi:hypothetical protein CRENBAI_016739 [Crenichthys baileyi]|uniref:Uncharacterized protein n=1 Tax=Crenichthys baileyi TaxID=28760 RepID=A0AAV9R156_9TELE